MEKELPVDINKVLEKCINGSFPEELKILYQAPYRDSVSWSEFPYWARPDLDTEGCHEG
jgi:hypothetical protein